MANTVTRLFNGSSLNFNGTLVAHLIGISYNCGGAEIEITEPDDLTALYESGLDELEVTARVKRVPSLARKTKGTLAATLKDGSTLSLSNITWMLMSIGGDGAWGGPFSGSLKFRPTVADA
jgi:hypothetical protein